MLAVPKTKRFMKGFRDKFFLHNVVLSATGFRDFLCAHYNVSPLNLHSHCDGCGTAFGVTHTLSCCIGSLVIARHNEIRDELLYLSRRAFTSAYVRAEPLIH